MGKNRRRNRTRAQSRVQDRAKRILASRITVSEEAPLLYFAYGSNLHVEQMTRRCPTARPFASMNIPNWRLAFRGVADITPELGAKVLGGAYTITPRDELALDRYEGFNPYHPSRGLYRKVYWLARINGQSEPRKLMAYVMNAGDALYMPGEAYFGCVREGYRNWKLDEAPLFAALEEAERVPRAFGTLSDTEWEQAEAAASQAPDDLDLHWDS